MAITAFRGRWARLSNYSPCLIFYNGHAYQSVEHAYQAQKTTDVDLQRQIRWAPGPAAAKKLARYVPLRADWEEIKLPLMRALLLEKFSQEPDRSLLLSTAGEDLVEGNTWGDRFWGQDPVGNGGNWLGRCLMDLRDQLLSGTAPTPVSEAGLF